MDDIEDLMDDTPLYDPDPGLLEVECPTCGGDGLCWYDMDEMYGHCLDCDGTGTVERNPDR